MEITEETLNHFLAGATIDRIYAYSGMDVAIGGDITGLQVLLPNGSFLSVYPDGDILHIGLLGSSTPEE